MLSASDVPFTTSGADGAMVNVRSGSVAEMNAINRRSSSGSIGRCEPVEYLGCFCCCLLILRDMGADSLCMRREASSSINPRHRRLIEWMCKTTLQPPSHIPRLLTDLIRGAKKKG